MEQEYQNALTVIGSQQIQIAKLNGYIAQLQDQIKELENKTQPIEGETVDDA